VSIEDGVRSLVVAGVHPWPATDGYRQRLQAFITALATLGPVDVFCFDDPTRRSNPALESHRPPGVRVIAAERVARPMRTRMWMWATGGLPRSVTVDDANPMLDTFRTELREPYDVALMSHVSQWLNFGELTTAPLIVDIDNLEHLVLRGSATKTAPKSLRERVRRRLDLADSPRMERLERRCASAASAVTLCSELDVGRSGLPNAHVIPNGYARIQSPRRRPTPGDAPEMIFVGLLSYRPNADAVRWFAEEVVPLVRREIPGALFRIVGRGGSELRDLGDLDGVELVGWVENLQAELDRSDLSVAPIRFGGGTRLKVTEALANRLPLVSTTIGSEGIDVVHRRHCMLADSAVDLAVACVEVLRDETLRRTLVSEGEALWEREYRWEHIHHRIAELVDQVIRTPSGPANR